MKIYVINGPSLGRLGLRQPEIYGHETLENIMEALRIRFPEVEISHCQSNGEGDIITAIFDAADAGAAGIVLNAGAYTHTSLAIADAIAAVDVPVVEVHLSNVFARETIRHTSLIAPVCKGVIAGFGAESYFLAINSFL